MDLRRVDDGRVYDLSGKVPRSAYEIAADVDIYWLDIHDGVLGVSDRAGRITTIDYEDEFQWARTGAGDSAWMVRCDEDAVYHGHSNGVARYDAADGTLVWENKVADDVLFGWQEAHSVYAGTARRTVHEVVLETSGGGDGVVVECVRDGERLRVRVVSPGYESWNVQFPKDIREAGVRYLVDGVRSAGRGGFYRAYGEIRRLH